MSRDLASLQQGDYVVDIQCFGVKSIQLERILVFLDMGVSDGPLIRSDPFPGYWDRRYVLVGRHGYCLSWGPGR